ncbi:MAG: phosphate ABC transporter substrate-binding protein [Clostridium sp.]|nr:phosphate ABC transporter substrate-binding protein [Clostridium sp.]
MKKKSMKLLIAAVVATMSIGVLTGCGSKENNGSDNASKNVTISISGSTSMGKLMEKEAESYKGKNQNVSIEIQQIGSSAGIKNVISGVSEIGMASRELKDEEKSQVKETTIAYDGIALITNPKNGVENLTMEDIKNIYTGQVTNWKELGGKDSPIVVVSREDGSGTRDAFGEIVGFKAEELIKEATISDGNGAVKTTVAGNENAIGYISFEHIDETVKALKVEGVEATPDKVLDKSYKLSRPFLVVSKEGKLTEEGQKFIDYILSEEGQKIVEETGGIKIK